LWASKILILFFQKDPKSIKSPENRCKLGSCLYWDITQACRSSASLTSLPAAMKILPFGQPKILHFFSSNKTETRSAMQQCDAGCSASACSRCSVVYEHPILYSFSRFYNVFYHKTVQRYCFYFTPAKKIVKFCVSTKYLT
jgi:hypothetical protein